MTDRAVHFEAIEIHRVRGIGQGEGFELSDLSPGVNLIHGPNGSGKSTTALVIQELLWSGRTGLQRPTVAGRIRDGESEYRVSIDAGHVETTYAGEAVPELGPPETRHRYRLALHELIGDDDSDSAKAIADASQGGYDLEAAAATLGFTERPSSSRKQSNRYKEVQQAAAEARRLQSDIRQDDDELDDIRKQRDRATAAGREIGMLEKAGDYHQATERCRQAALRLDALPEGVAKLRGDERKELDQLAKRREQLEDDLAGEREGIEDSKRVLIELSLPDDGIDKEGLARLRAGQRRLGGVETEVRQQRQQLSVAEAEQQKARYRVGRHLTDGQLSSIERVEIGELSAFARRSDRVRSRQQVIEEHRRRLDREEPEEVRGLEEQQIQEGIATLGRWLASPVPARGLWWPIAVAAALTTGLGITLALVHHRAWALVALAAVGVVLWERWLRRSHAVHRQSYEATGLQPPEAWEVPAVSELMHRLVQLAGVRAHEDELRRRRGDVQLDAEAVEQKRAELDQQRREIEDRLGLDVEVEDEWLPLLVGNIGSWQRSSAEAAGAKQVLLDLEQEQQALLRQINTALGPFGYGEIDSADVAAQSIEDLADRLSRQRIAITGRTDAERRIEQTIEPGLQDIARQRQDVLDRLGLDESDESTINDWLAELTSYVELNKELADAETIREDRRQALAGNEDLLKLDPIEVQQQIDEQQRIAAERDALSEQIARTESAVDKAKAGHELSDALLERDTAAAALAEARDRSDGAATGALLTKWVRANAIERSRPQVLRRANDLVVRFTGGTLRLELDHNASPPGFRARRGSELPRPVDQLSVGERVQLLIAVRVAFLEQDEPTRLPLLLDEALGTSDDHRARLIIDSVIEIAREGRQVFYFTAQHDEAGKWVTRLAESGVPYKKIDLAQIRRLGAAAAAPLQIAAVEVPRPPAPDGRNHLEYGRILGVPNVDPAVESLDGLHIWHLLEDVELLHQLLCRRVTTWGQLRTLLEHGGAGIVEVADTRFERAATAAKAVAAACRAWRIGRGKRVDRRALQDSDCVSDSFVDELTALAEREEGDARAIVETLESGEVSRWRTKNTEILRQFFEEDGFLSADDPLQPDEIRIRVVAAVADELREGRFETRLVDRIVASLPATTIDRRTESREA